MKDLLAPFGKEGDNCMRSILQFLFAARGLWVNKAELSLQKFAYTEKGRTKFFSPETIGRKARNLAELGLLQRNEINHTAEYRWPESQTVAKQREIQIVERDGRKIAIFI